MKEKLKQMVNRLLSILKTAKFDFYNQGFYSIGGEIGVVDSRVTLEFTLAKYALNVTFKLKGE